MKFFIDKDGLIDKNLKVQMTLKSRSRSDLTYDISTYDNVFLLRMDL